VTASLLQIHFWYELPIGMFFVSSVQFLFLGVLGEYIGPIYTQVRNRPLAVERERESP
jgi:hypothetical protein